MQKNKNTFIIIIAIIVMAIIVMVLVKNNKKSVNLTETPNDNVQQTDQAINGVKTNKTAKNATTSVASISYEQALIKYKDYRIQLAQDCQATPVNVTYKNGTSIMIDNRSNVERVVRVGSNYTIPAWGFKIINLTSSTLPATWLVDCGAQQNVATILIQK
jgi:uncharacterized protein YxeA